jgi:biopolymer transport protein ExbD
MAFQIHTKDQDVISSINTTPLVDVMLVLLIIFLITVPVVNTSVPISLPKERVENRLTKPENVIVSADKKGNIYFFDTKISTMNDLVNKLKAKSSMSPQPEIQIRGDSEGTYEAVGKIILACQKAGLSRVSFITEPPSR